MYRIFKYDIIYHAGQTLIIYFLPYYQTMFIAAIRVWYGDPEIAIVSTDAGKWDPNFELSNIFDSDATTSWHSANGTQGRTKIITIDFLVRTSNSMGLYHMTLSVWATVWANLWIGP